jgi:colanic acid/amylovoran biosynthesis protein
VTATPRVLITNCVVLNGGDAAILYGLLDRLRAAIGPELEVVVIDDQPGDVTRRYPELDTSPRLDTTLGRSPSVRILGRIVAEVQRARVLAGAWCIGRGWVELPRLWLSSAQRSALELFRGSTAVVSTGGTYLVERYPIAGRLLELEVALAMRRPLVLFTQSLGPFTEPRHRRAMRTIASRARLVLLRDERSRRHLMDLGIAGDRVHVVADSAFALSARRPTRTDQRLRVAVSVRDWPYAAGDASATNDRYREAIRALVERLVGNRGAEVTFLSTCQGAPEYWADDSAVGVAIADRLDPGVRGAVHVDRAFRTPQELLDVLGGFDLVVATRMHMAILALVAGVPVFPIAYEPKTRELFERLQVGHWVRDLDEVSASSLPDDVERFLDELPELTGALRASVDAERRSALATADLLARALTAASIGAAEAGDAVTSGSGNNPRAAVARAFRWARFAGWRVRCPICGRRARRFDSYHGRSSAVCVHCHSLERHRALWLWLRRRIPADATLLHVAPEEGIAARLRSLPIDYVSTDLESPLAMRHDDITALPDPDGSFDVVICNHVLEHIPDDRTAMREIYRVLRPGGFAVLQHPIAPRPDTYEDPSVSSPQDRLRLFGQDDHVRIYGWDFVERLHEAGFENVEAAEIERDVAPELHGRYGLRPSPTVIARR